MQTVSQVGQASLKAALFAGTVLASIGLAQAAFAQGGGGATALGGAGAPASAPTALPSGGKVTSGQAQIATAGKATTINQTSNKAILTWDQFSIGQGGLVQFNNGTGSTLNRVTGTSVSSIDGRLSATGSVYLINPNGIIIGSKGIVDTGGSFVASTQNLSDANFLSGGPLTFAGPSGASVINLGKVSSLGGNVALIAAKISNEGSITAANGTAGLLAGTSVLMRDAALDDGLFLVQAGGTDTSVTHKGAIEAASAELKAQNGSVYALAGNTASYIKATGTGTKGGQIWLLAGQNGTTSVSGTSLTATNGDKGGFIETSGGMINVADDVQVSTKAANGALGTWLIDPNDFKVAATGGNITGALLSSQLASNNVTIKSIQGTTAGNGDIFVNDTVTWSSASTLTLDAYRNININKVITVAGAGGVNLIVGDQAQNGIGDATKGDYSFGLTGNGFAGRIDYTGTGGSLNINGAAYTLLYNINVTSTLSGNYALAKNIDFNNQLSNTSIINSFYGNFVGLGHTVSRINVNALNTDIVGFFGTLYSGTIRDVGIASGSVVGKSHVGALVGFNSLGKILNTYASATVRGDIHVAGLVASNLGRIQSSYATGNVSGIEDIGGLIASQTDDPGNAYRPVIENSYATGNVTGQIGVGGLAGGNAATIINCYATGAVTASLGRAGGLVGGNYRLKAYYFTVNDYVIGKIYNSYATGRVSAPVDAGGLVGVSESGEILNVAANYAIGSSYTPAILSTATVVSNSYWDTQTTGQTTSANGGSGRTTAQLQSALPSGFDTAIWGGGGGLYPYMKAFGVPKPITGFAYQANGSASKGATVTFFTDGVQRASVIAGANGYYYYANQGAVPFTATKLGATVSMENASSVSGAYTSDSVSLSGSKLSNFNIKSGLLSILTTKTALTNTLTDPNSVFGQNIFAALLANTSITKTQISAANAFTIDTAYSSNRAVIFEAKNGNLTIAANGSVSSTATGDGVVLAANGALINNAGASAISTPNGRWLISTTTPDGSSADIFGGLAGKNYYGSAYTFGTGFAKAPASGNRFVHSYRPTLTVNGETKTVTYNGATQSASYALSGYRAGDQTLDVLSGSASGSTNSKNVGTYAVTPAGNLTSEMNYAISYAPGTLTITKAPLSLSTVADAKTYDASTLSTKAVQFSGLKGTDTITGLTQVFDSKNAGSRTLVINPGYLINDGNNGGNYAVATTSATGTISKASLTLAATSNNRTYDATKTSTGTVTVTGLKGTDAVTGLTQTFDNKNAGPRTLSVNAGYVVSDGNNGGNYNVVTVKATGRIYKAALTLAAVTDTKAYDGTTISTKAVTVIGLKGTDSISNLAQSFDSEEAGQRDLSVNTGFVVSDGNNGANYVVTTQTAEGAIN